jgi:cytochrome P450
MTEPGTIRAEYDPYSYALDADPYPHYRALRDRAPVYRNEQLDFWALTRFDDVLQAFADFETFSSARGTVLELMDRPVVGPLIIFMDPPRQTRLRNLVSKAFTPRRIAKLEPTIREIARGHLDKLVGRNRFDAVVDFTAKFPMDVISTMLGIPSADRDSVRGWSNDVLHRDPGNPMPPPRALRAIESLMDYFTRALAECRRRPRDDMMSDLVRAELRGEDGKPERLTDLEIKSFFNLLATAGNETVTKLLATAIYCLWKNPGQRRLLLEDPALIPNAVEETLRYDPPSQYQGRVLTRDVELHGTLVPRDARVLLINGATGRDERKFSEPERFDVRRSIDQHLGFGYGRHVCLGAFLARLESRVALEEFLQRFPDYEVSKGGIERMHSSNVRGFAGLKLEIE